MVDSPADTSRLNNYKVMYFLKNGEPGNAITHCLVSHRGIRSAPLKEFDLFWFLRAVNDCLLHTISVPEQTPPIISVDAWAYAVEGADFQIRNADIEASGHPRDLVWREIALFEHHRNNRSKASKALAKSRKYFISGRSPILEHLSEMLDKHHHYINDKISSLELQKYSSKEQYLSDLRRRSPY